MLVQGATAQVDKQHITQIECEQVLSDIKLWDEVVERATLNLIFRKEEITIPNIVNELTLMGYEVIIHEQALKHLIIHDVRKVVASVSVL